MWKTSQILKKLACINQHDFQGFKLKVSKMSHWKQTMIVLFCINKSVLIIIPNAANIFTKLSPKTATQMN